MFISKLLSFEVDQLLNDAQQGLMERVENIVWPSEASADLGPYTVGECKRSLFYKMIGQKPTEPMSVRGKAVCDAGKMYELLQIQKFKDIGLDPQEQVRIQFNVPNSTKNVKHSGKIDAVINDGAKRGIEIKSYSGYKTGDITGNESKIPLPTPPNLMQAMLYKYWTVRIPEGKKEGIEDIYLMYINRNDGSIMYFKIDLDKDNYPVITPIDYAGRTIGSKISVVDFPSFDAFSNGSEIATPELGRIAELRISVNDIFDKFDLVCDHKEKRSLPSADFKPVYNKDDIDNLLRCGRITKIKRSKLLKDGGGDMRCGFCSYRKKCLSDSGINFK